MIINQLIIQVGLKPRLEGKGTCETPEVTERRNKFFNKMKIASTGQGWKAMRNIGEVERKRQQ